MRIRLALITLIPFFVAPAIAGPFDFVTDAWRLSIPLPPLFAAAMPSPKLRAAAIPVVPTGSDCAPRFVPGGDGLFRRTDYCHRDAPSGLRGFLELGYDVPASFLVGFTEEDVLLRWQGVKFPTKEFLGSNIELPTTLLTQLNATAARAWETMLACAEANPDRAREMYRSGRFTCAGQERALLAELAEIRASVPTLAATLEVVPFFSEDAINQLERDLARRLEQRRNGHLEEDPEGYARDAQRLFQLRQERADWRKSRRTYYFPMFVNQFLPKLPRLHPLLAQVMVEELLTLVKPDEAPSSLIQRSKEHPERIMYLTQLIIWITAVADRDCAAFGLWPSAIRTALDSLGHSVLETMTDYKERMNYRTYIPVICVRNPYLEGASPELAMWAPSTIENERSLMRLPDSYTRNRFTIWRELLEARERQLAALKR